MGFEDEVEQSFERPCRQCDGGFKRTYELTSSIVPRGTSFAAGWSSISSLLHLILHIFPIVRDPVGAGFVESLARPGGNATGFMSTEFSASATKRSKYYAANFRFT
jgi:hypothetical protein